MTHFPNVEINQFTPVVGYVRCSTDLQEESPEQQKKEILAFAERHAMAIVDWLVDFGESGTKFDQRPEFQRLRIMVESKPKFKAVICYDESRWGRAIDAEENTYWRVYFRKRGVDVLLVKTSVDPKNEFAPMLKAFESVQASQYSKKLSELTLRGAKDNGIYSSGGVAPYAYTRVAVNLKTGAQRPLADGEYAVRYQEKVLWAPGKAEEIETVQYIFDKRAAGIAYISIVEQLNQRGTPSPMRGRWRNRDQKWSVVSVKTIIENPAYYGARAYNKNSMSSIVAQSIGRDPKNQASYPHWRNRKEDWVIVEDAHEPLVAKDLWIKVNDFKKPRGRTSRNQHDYRSPYLLTGVMCCASCGFAFQGWSGTSKGIPYLRYIDGGWKNKRVCTYLAIPKDRVELFAIDSVRETLTDPSTVKRIEERLQLLLHREPLKRQNEVEVVQRALEENRQKQRNIVEVMEQRPAGFNPKTLFDRLEELEKQRQELETRLLAVETQEAADSIFLDSSRSVASFVLGFEENFKSANPFAKKALLRACISQMIVDRDRNRIYMTTRLIPAATPQLEHLLKKETAATKVVTAGCSGGRT